VLAAHRAGVRTVILPKENESDLERLPDSVREEMEFILAEHVDTVLENALGDLRKPPLREAAAGSGS
jgi:ATP-dependent Lon protease